MKDNLFENAYFGKAYKTRGGEKRIYLAPYEGGEMHKLLDTYHNIEYLHKNGQYAERYPLSCDIVSEWQEEINEEELDRLANSYFQEDALCQGVKEGYLCPGFVNAFKAGYRKAIEQK